MSRDRVEKIVGVRRERRKTCEEEEWVMKIQQEREVG